MSAQKSDAPESDPAAAEAGIGRGRKIRLAVLVVVLLIVGGLAAAHALRRKRQQRRRAEQLKTALQDLRQRVSACNPDLPRAEFQADIRRTVEKWREVKELDPDNEEADALGVALLYVGMGSVQRAVKLFNGLDVKKLASRSASPGPDGTAGSYSRARKAIDKLQIRPAFAQREAITDRGADYLRRQGFLWGTAHQIMPAGASDTEKALTLLQWMALHMKPVPTDPLAADANLVLLRGYGSPPQLAWLYAELARQSDLLVRVAAPSEGAPSRASLVQVYPQEREPFLVNPRAGVPVMNPEDGHLLSLEELRNEPAFAASAAGLPDDAGHDLDGVQPKAALHPYALFPRFLVFDHLLSVMNAHPRVSFRLEELPPADQADVWRYPVAAVDKSSTPEHRQEAARHYRALASYRPVRLLQLQGQNRGAVRGYEGKLEEFKEVRQSAEVAEALSVLDRAIEDVTFFKATIAFDVAAFEQAAAELRTYLEDYPGGRWRLLAHVLLAEAALAGGEEEAARLWAEVPSQRSAYARLRRSGMLAAPRNFRQDAGDTAATRPQ